MGKLDGKVAVITGGSTGMALAGAKLFVEEGAHVFIQARRQEALDGAVALIGRNVTAVQGDAAELDDLDRLCDTVKREKGSIDVLWASAGMGEPAVLGDITEEQFDRAFSLNARGTLFTVQKALPLLNDGASVILNGSTNVDVGDEGLGVYAATKAATRSFARTWANELKGRGIRVNTVTPGPTDTPALSGLTPDPEGFQRQLATRVPLGRLARPEEIAAAVAFLASGQSSFITGSSLYVDGGLNQI